MAYDRMGRRIVYHETRNGANYINAKFVYNGYLCIQRLYGGSNGVYQSFVWDPTEQVATRPLCMQVPSWGSTVFYMHDGNKNVSDVIYYAVANGIAAHYDYAPFGAITRTARDTRMTGRDFIGENPFRFSSEYHDNTLGLVYYNYRHYNSIDGRWCGRDPIESAVTYGFLSNMPILMFDRLGLLGEFPSGQEAYDNYVHTHSWHTTVNDSLEALENYKSNRGGTANAGEHLIQTIKNSSDYSKMHDNVIRRVHNEAQKQCYLGDSGTFPIEVIMGGAYTENNAIGGISYRFEVKSCTWTAQEYTGNCRRMITVIIYGTFSFSDKYEFRWDSSRPIKNFFSDTIPGIIAGQGTPFTIVGSWNETIVIRFSQ